MDSDEVNSNYSDNMSDDEVCSDYSENMSDSDSDKRPAKKPRMATDKNLFKHKVMNVLQKAADVAIPVAPGTQTIETKLINLFKNWKSPRKLVYALKHKYSESSLCFENLKTTDKTVADILKYIAKISELSIYLTIFYKQSFGQGEGYYHENYDHSDADFDSSDDDVTFERSYELKKLVSLGGDEIFSTSRLTVNFAEEVIPEDCFKNMEPYVKSVEPTEDAEVEVNKYYRSAAIVLWPKEFTLQVLKDGGAPTKVIGKLFLKEVEKFRGREKDEKTKKHLLTLAWSVLSSRNDNWSWSSLPLINAITQMENLELTQKLFSKSIDVNDATIPLILNECEKYGWPHFSTAIQSILKDKPKEISLTFINRLVEHGNVVEEKKNLCHKLLENVLEKCKEKPQSSSSGYARPPTLQEKKSGKEEQDSLHSICLVAEKVAFNMLEYAKSKSLLLFVPVLLRLLPENSNGSFLEIANYFVSEMEKELTLSWRRDVKITCSCNDCIALNHFLRSNNNTKGFNIRTACCQHFHQRINSIKDFAYETVCSGEIKMLYITKTQITGYEYEESLIRKFSQEFLPQLREILPSNS